MAGEEGIPLQTLMLQPSRAQPGDAPPPPPATEGAPADGPGGQAPPTGPFGGMGMMLLLPLLMFGLIFFMNRSDKKRREQIESGLKKGDRVVTRAGFIGKVVEIQDVNVRVEIAPGVVVSMIKSAIEGLADPDAGKKDGKKDDKADDKKKKAS